MTASAHKWAKTLAKTMKTIRQFHGMGLREYARHIGLNPATLHRIENGKGCDVVTLVRIRETTGIRYEVLLG